MLLLSEQKKASCPPGKQTECDQDVGRAAGTSFEDKAAQWTIWIMYCSTRMTESKHCLSKMQLPRTDQLAAISGVTQSGISSGAKSPGVLQARLHVPRLCLPLQGEAE